MLAVEIRIWTAIWSAYKIGDLLLGVAKQENETYFHSLIQISSYHNQLVA